MDTGTGVGGQRARRVSILVVLTLLVAGLGVLRPAVPARAAGPTVGVASSMVNVRPTQVPVGLPGSVSLTAVRNEAESFQVVISGPATAVSVSGDLFGWGTTTLYRVGYYDATRASDREGGTGLWGDALIPERDIVYHEDRTAFPVDVAAGRNQVAWVDVFVPTTVPAGSYSDSLQVTSSAGTTSVPVTIDVIDWTMPATSSLRSVFLNQFPSGASNLCWAHTNSGSCNNDPAKQRTLHSLYARMALEDRFTIANGAGLRFDYSPAQGDPSGEWETKYESPIVHGTTSFPAGATWRLVGARSTAVTQLAETVGDQCSAACADQWEAEANEPGGNFTDQFVWYACDEPGSDAAKWNACAANFAGVKNAWNTTSLVTAPIDQYNARPAAFPAVEVLVVIDRFMQSKPGYGGPYIANQRSTYDAFLAQPGHELWLYSACDSYACSYTPSPGDPTEYDDSPFYDGWPGYAIDQPAVQSRAQSWMDYKFSVTGDLYWAVDEALRTAWAPGGQYAFGGNGDGTLFYPGTPTSINGSVAIGGTTDIPIESIRMKRLRDGREDYEYMKYLTDHGQGPTVRSIVDGLFPTMYAATPDKDGNGSDSLLAARGQLTALVRAVVGGSAAVPPVAGGSIVFSSDRDGDFELFTMPGDGSQQVQLTDNSVTDRFPSWSPDGSRIAWTQGDDVLVMSADGTSTVNLTADIADRAEKPSWASSDSIVFVRHVGARSELWSMSSTSGRAKLVVATRASVGGDVYDPVVSVGGALFASAVDGAGQVGVITSSVVGAAMTSIAALAGPGLVYEAADVSASGARLAISRSIAGGQYDVVTTALDGSQSVNITATVAGGSAASDYQPTWAPDDRSLAIVSLAGGDSDIWRVAADGSSAVALTSSVGADLDPDWGPAVAAGPADFVALEPGRLLDTRAGEPTTDGVSAGGGIVEAGTELRLAVGGRLGVPVDAAAVSLNVTVADPEAAGYVTVYPCGSPRPTASNVNYVAGQIVPNAVLTKLGTAATVCIFNQSRTHLVVDVGGYFPRMSRYESLVPARLADTRPGSPVIDSAFVATGALPGGQVLAVKVTGRGGTPVGARTAALNVTAVGSQGFGFVTVYPCGAARPVASTLNTTSAYPVANAVLSQIGADGRVCIYSSVTTDLVVDLDGTYGAVSDYAPLVPARLADTRPGEPSIDGLATGTGSLVAGATMRLQVATRGGVPVGATSASLNVTVTGASGSGFVTVYPCGGARPTASTLDFIVGQTVANMALTDLGPDGSVCLYSSTPTHLVVDVVGSSSR